MTKEFFSQHLQLHGLTVHSLADVPFLSGTISTGQDRTLLLYFQHNPMQPVDQTQHLCLKILPALSSYYSATSTQPLNLKWLIQTASSVDDTHLNATMTRYAALLQADACVAIHTSAFDERIPLLALGARGLLSLEMSVAGGPEPLHSSYGAIVSNALWRLTWALSNLKDAREEILIDGFYDAVRPVEDDESALVHTLSQGTFLQHMQTGHSLLEIEGFQLHYAHLLTPTCTITSISGGEPATEAEYRTMMLPASATARVDMHLVPEQDPRIVFQQIQQHLSAQGFQDVLLRLLSTIQPVHTPLTHPFVQLVRQATATAYGREPLVVPLLPYSLALAPLQRGLAIPVMIVPGGYDRAQTVDALVQQIALITEGQW